MTTDEPSVQATEDTGLSDVTDTSATADTQDADLDLEDIEISLDDLEADDESDDESEETAATETTEDAEEEAQPDVDDEEPQEEDTPSPEDKRAAAAEAFRQREAQRIQREAEKERQATDYLDAAEDAKDLALRQLQVDAYNNRVERNTSKLETAIDRAVVEIDLFRTGTPEQKEVLAQSLDTFEKLYVTRDKNGDPVEVKGDVYQHLLKEADTIRLLAGVGARQESKHKSNVKARTDVVPTRAPKEAPKDSDLEDFDAGWN